MPNPSRRKHRFQHFEKSFQVLSRMIDLYDANPEDEVYRLAMIRSFKMTYELSWKTMQNHLEQEGINQSTPRSVIRAAYQAGIIKEGEEWLNTIEFRNLTSHAYEEEISQKIIQFINNTFYALARDLYRQLLKKEL